MNGGRSSASPLLAPNLHRTEQRHCGFTFYQQDQPADLRRRLNSYTFGFNRFYGRQKFRRVLQSRLHKAWPADAYLKDVARVQPGAQVVDRW